MKQFVLLLIYLLAYFICYKIGYETGRIDMKKLYQQRVFNMYGEGDLGTEINYYLQTGDTSVQNYN